LSTSAPLSATLGNIMAAWRGRVSGGGERVARFAVQAAPKSPVSVVYIKMANDTNAVTIMISISMLRFESCATARERQPRSHK
jgi:hypothetical protein